MVSSGRRRWYRAAIAGAAQDRTGHMGTVGTRGYSWVKNALQKANAAPRTKGKGKHRRKRERRPLSGMMLHQVGAAAAGQVLHAGEGVGLAGAAGAVVEHLPTPRLGGEVADERAVAEGVGATAAVKGEYSYRSGGRMALASIARVSSRSRKNDATILARQDPPREVPELRLADATLRCHPTRLNGSGAIKLLAISIRAISAIWIPGSCPALPR